MQKYRICGGTPLSGTVTISGAKNAAVAILPATLLVKGVCHLENVPNISDVRLLLDILRGMGASVNHSSPNTVEIDCSAVENATAPIELVAGIGSGALAPALGISPQVNWLYFSLGRRPPDVV